MTNPGDRLDVVLDTYIEDDAYRIVLVGVFRPGEPIPATPEGATRNIVQSWLEIPHHARAFAVARR